ncbi:MULTISPECIES: OadG family protein [Desulfococcus]|uniref:Sodium pump decarboxylase gamma subunit n=1 Tax=Desulfococcus multivorans DSM 2059 TaxID=1121405 RepID=S7UXG2_DESML|nr:OadG family protein [Desulfococcus multivorans]AOY57819.1 conserved uncharacterized protein [Desulfococcus multivorans]AQV00204.1 hypothetical protein B2D07_05070 [Desulfococcus multivorans]EPR38904.1 sodium pump decarboxylase gamma subunit [Desulfococcus multivorans DSM 2059]MDX9818113.1 OadG family protein [Desulfococcus multivorans]SJZ67598.1 Oxaloacetate decarboxylase, gamma chain [Desulfococcus multivorans DSM 2059]
MTGFEAISAHNGWSIAAVGISIVFTGLVLLSVAIAQLHKILAFWEDRDQFYEQFRKKRDKHATTEEVCIVIPGNIQEPARHFKLLADRMAEPFALPKLLENAVRCGISHPHSTLNTLLLSDIVVPDGEGYYRWNQNARL